MSYSTSPSKVALRVITWLIPTAAAIGFIILGGILGLGPISIILTSLIIIIGSGALDACLAREAPKGDEAPDRPPFLRHIIAFTSVHIILVPLAVFALASFSTG